MAEIKDKFSFPIPKIEWPKIVGKIDIYSIDSSTRPIKPLKHSKLPQYRDQLDSGWAISERMIKRNYLKNK